MSSKRILFVEDDPYLGMMVNDLFESKGFMVFYEKTAETGYKIFLKEKPDLCVLDVMLPGMDGFELGKKIRNRNSSIPIIFLTARSHKDDIIEGFASGADDYIRKPFHMEELILRINAILKRNIKTEYNTEEKRFFEFDAYKFDSELMQLHYNNQISQLTSKESEMLKIFCLNQGKLVEREFILKEVWGDDNYYNIQSMDVFLYKLRSRFGNNSRIKIINIRGKGFKMLIANS